MHLFTSWKSPQDKKNKTSSHKLDDLFEVQVNSNGTVSVTMFDGKHTYVTITTDCTNVSAMIKKLELARDAAALIASHK